MTNRTELAYDGANRLRQVRSYGTNGVLTNTVRYVWSGGQLMGELDGSNKLVRTFTHGVDGSGTIGGAGGIGGLVGIRSYVAPVTNYYVRHDGKGNVTEVRRFSGTTAASYGYYEFGGIRYQTNTYMQNIRWQSRIHHAQSGFYFWPQRVYDPVTARWLSRDPIQEDGGINLYQYALNNPVNYYDPDGLAVETLVDVVSVGYSGVEFINDPTWGNAGNLGWDVAAAFIPGLPGSYSKKGLSAIGKKCKKWLGFGAKGKPKGVPDDFVVSPSKKGGGTRYSNPNNKSEVVREMPGNPNSPNPAQRQPYVKHTRDGKALDRNGNPVSPNSPEAHIPVDDFEYRP